MNNTTDESSDGVTMNAQIDVAYYDSGQPDRLEISWRVSNDSAVTIAVLDTGESLDSRPPRPAYRMSRDADLTIAFGLAPLEPGTFGAPKSVYGLRVEPGEQYRRVLPVKLLSRYPVQDAMQPELRQPRRVRFCQGYAPFFAALFAGSDAEAGVRLMRPGDVEGRVVLCSDWYNLAWRK